MARHPIATVVVPILVVLAAGVGHCGGYRQREPHAEQNGSGGDGANCGISIYRLFALKWGS